MLYNYTCVMDLNNQTTITALALNLGVFYRRPGFEAIAFLECVRICAHVILSNLL